MLVTIEALRVIGLSGTFAKQNIWTSFRSCDEKTEFHSNTNSIDRKMTLFVKCAYLFYFLAKETYVYIRRIIKNWIFLLYNSRHLIDLAAMVYEPLYHAREIATIKLSSGCSCKAKSARSSNNFWMLLTKQLFHSRLLDMK